jgi:hypothetical protein
VVKKFTGIFFFYNIGGYLKLPFDILPRFDFRSEAKSIDVGVLEFKDAYWVFYT